MTVECEIEGVDDHNQNKAVSSKKTPPTKVVIRKLPPTFTEDEFLEVITPLPDHNYFYFAGADKRLGAAAFSRAYINFSSAEDVVIFKNMYDSYVFVDQKGNEYPAIVEYAPFQKIPKQTPNPQKDARCGTIDSDADYLAFLESLENPETVSLPHLEQVLEEIEAKDRQLRANHGIMKVKTPLLEYIEKRQSEKLLQVERRKKRDFERKKAREEERKRRKEQFSKKDEKADWPLKKKENKRLEDYPKSDRRNRRESDKTDNDEKSYGKKYSKEFVSSKYKVESSHEEVRSKRYSEGRKPNVRKNREETKTSRQSFSDESKGKSPKKSETTDSTDCQTKKLHKNYPESVDDGHERVKDLPDCPENDSKLENSGLTTAESKKERRIRNKDRPDMQLYRPGQSRLKLRAAGDETSNRGSDSSSSISPTEQLHKDSKMDSKLPAPKVKQDSDESNKPEVKKSYSYSKYRAANRKDVNNITLGKNSK